MHKIIVAGPGAYFQYKDQESKTSIMDSINQAKRKNIEFETMASEDIDVKELEFIAYMTKSPYNKLVVLNSDIKVFLQYGIQSSKIVMLGGKTEQDAFNKMRQYLNLPSFYDKENKQQGDIKLHHKGTKDLVIKAPKFTDKEPEFNEVAEPKFSSELERITKYSYYFGIDKIEVCKSKINQECCYVSDYVDVGNFKDGDYVQLDADYSLDDNCSIEFYIIDGEQEIPILPYKETFVQNEKIFYNTLTRFIMNPNKPAYIYKNFITTKLSLEDVISKNDGLYTISYSPIDCYDYKPKNQSIQIKAIIRMYDETKQPPYINYINIRKFGGEMVWKDNI